MDPQDPYADGEGGGDPATGPPTPVAEDDPAALKARIAELEQRNAKLRADERQMHAGRLGDRYGLTPTQVELLASIDRDKQEEKAKAIADEIAGRTPAAPSPEPTQPAAPTPTEPATPAEPPAPTPEPEPAPPSLLQQMSEDRSQPVPVPVAQGFQAELDAAVANAKSVAEIEQIQQDFKRRQREAMGQS